MVELAQSSKSIRLGYTFAIASAILFGAIPTLAKPISSSMHPLVLSSFVYLVSAATLSTIARKKALVPPRDKRDYLLILAISIVGAVIAPSLYFMGLQQTTASDATLLAEGEVVFTLFLAIAFFNERVRPVGYIAIFLVLIGLVIITTNLSSRSIPEANYGNLLIILSSLFWGLDNNLIRIVLQRVDAAKVAFLKSAIGGSVVLAMILLFQIPLPKIDSMQAAYILILGSAGFGASLYLFMQGLKRLGTVKTMLLLSLSTVFGLFFAWAFLHEQISGYQVIASGVMISGIYMIYRKDNPLN